MIINFNDYATRHRSALPNELSSQSSYYTTRTNINIEQLKDNALRLSPDLITAPDHLVESVVLPEHSAEPIKDVSDIMNISRGLIADRRYRDNMLFIVGINFGLRVSDLRALRFADLINQDLTFKSSFPVFEIKTRNTRKRKANRYITVNIAVVEAVTLYLEHTPNVTLADHLFTSNSNNGAKDGAPLSARSIDRITKSFKDYMSNKSVRLSTHTFRKTFCYHQMLISNNDTRKLMLLQKMLGHSSPAQTLDYIGITDEEIESAYRALNLGSEEHCYLVSSKIVEEPVYAI